MLIGSQKNRRVGSYLDPPVATFAASDLFVVFGQTPGPGTDSGPRTPDFGLFSLLVRIELIGDSEYLIEDSYHAEHGACQEEPRERAEPAVECVSTGCKDEQGGCDLPSQSKKIASAGEFPTGWLVP